MKSLALVVLLAACSSKPVPVAGGSDGSGGASGSGAPRVESDMCTLGKDALAALTSCNGKPLDANMIKGKQQIVTVIDTVSAKTHNSDLPTACAQLIRTFDDELAKVGCELPLAPATRTRMYDLIEQWYAFRTPVTATGNSAADAKIQTIAGVRDAACKCKDAACLDGISAQVDQIGTFGSDAPPAALELAGKLLDDINRCNAALTKPVKRH